MRLEPAGINPECVYKYLPKGGVESYDTKSLRLAGNFSTEIGKLFEYPLGQKIHMADEIEQVSLPSLKYIRRYEEKIAKEAELNKVYQL
jgi:hypothetical protein